MNPTIAAATELLDDRQLEALTGLRTDLFQVVRCRLPSLLPRVAAGELTRQQAGALLVELAQRRAAGDVLPPTREAIEDIVELGRLARPLPDETLRRIARLPACHQLANHSWDERTGTKAGYDAHRAANEPVCDACRSAAAAYDRTRRRARRAVAA